MHKRNHFKIFFLLFLFCIGTSFAVEKVYLAPIGLVGLHPDYALASAKLMKAHMEIDGRFLLTTSSPEDSVTSTQQQKISEIAKSKGCTKYIIAEFTRLKENAILSFKLYNVGEEAPIWDDRLKAYAPDDFDDIIQKVSKAIGTKNKAAKESDYYSTSEQNNTIPKYKGQSTYMGFSLGGIMPIVPEFELDAGFNIFLLHDAQNILFSLDFDSYGISDASNYSFLDISISISYPFTKKIITPFAGGGISYSSGKYEYDGMEEYNSYNDYSVSKDGGLSAFATSGVVFNRTKRAIILLRLNYILNIYKNTSYKVEKDSKSGYDIIRKKNLIHGPSVNLGIGYGF